MWRTTSLVLISALALAPAAARAADEDEAEAAEKDESADTSKEKKQVAEADAESEEEEAEEDPSKAATFLTSFPPRRYTYILGGAFVVGGLAFAFSAQGEAKRSDTITSAAEAQAALVNARASAAMASVMYGLAAATLIYAFVLEFLPEPVAEKASLTFHF